MRLIEPYLTDQRKVTAAVMATDSSNALHRLLSFGLERFQWFLGNARLAAPFPERLHPTQL